jgi:uncharacterized protein YeaO (DUF488 family)
MFDYQYQGIEGSGEKFLTLRFQKFNQNVMIQVKRVYDQRGTGEIRSILVDRLWPRGISKEKSRWDEWMKDLSPSDELRKWFQHDPEKWDEFRKRYKNELSSKKEELKKLKDIEKEYGTLTLLYSAKNEELNNAVALKEILDRMD